MDYFNKIIIDIELHHVEGIRECFENGINPNDLFHGSPLIDEMITMYTRTPRFKECIKVFVDYGLKFEDPVLLAVLMDDSEMLDKLILQQPEIVIKRYSLKCTYTPLEDVTLLHICAEYNHVACARVLVKHKADINAVAGIDQYGFGGQTPIFHTVNSNNDHSAPMMHFLLDHGANLDVTVRGIIWGKSFDWETLVPYVNPISYAMMGLLPQMHRSEVVINNKVRLLLKERYDIEYPLKNVPNKYLKT
ncbi:MAG: ankyrin repeat domain-containing protein [Saprospiraceae bacterium]|nr:ankyrin repeat domain-containing protein [Saprospiraceae bacterium]MBP6568012.1 ankyrin repeat domain-containing protein [Saprospiraceae bacterium]